MKMTMTIGLVLLAVASTPRWAAAQSTQEIVDQFFPAARLTLEDAEDKRSCFAVYDTTASGAPATIVAGYTNTTVGVVSVLTRNSDDTFSVAAENAPTWTLIGYTCEVALTDVDGVAGSEIMVTLAGYSDSEAWIFKWSGTQLENLTATRSENDELLSEFVNATLLDLQHDGTWQVYSARPLVDAESSPQVAPNVTFRLTPSGYVNDKDAVIAEVREISTEDWPTAAPFLSMAGRTGPYTLRVVNGNRAGQKRVSGASIKLNGVELLTPGQVTTSIEFLTIEVTATLAIKNTLDVTLTGNLGDYVTIVVELPPQPLIVLM